MALLIDGLIIVVYFAAITCIGLYMGRREKSLHDFALGGRSMPWWAVMASIIAAETSAATFLGAPGEGFENRSLAYVQLIIGLIIGRMLVGYVFLKPYYEYKVYTVYDFLGVRFGPMSKNYVSALFLFMRTLASGTRMFVPSLVMVLAWRMFRNHGEPVKYEPITHVWPYVVAIGVLTLLTCIYTAAGGIKAVIWTDVVQAMLMFGSALVAIATLLHHIGGFHAVAENVPQMTQMKGYFLTGFETEAVEKFKQTRHIAGDLGAWNYVLLVLGSQYTLFSATIGSMFLNMAAFGTDQDMVQRLLTAETYKKSRRSLITAAVMDLPIAAAFTFIGILLWVYYKQDPTYLPRDASGKAVNSDVFGSYILNVMPVGIRGLVLAGVFATAMGSLSAALNALATSATNDWYIPYAAKKKTETHHVFAARMFTAVFAVLMIVIASAFAYAKVRDPNVRIIPVVLGIAGFILGPMLGVFLLGMITRRRGSDVGNMLAITLGLMVTIVAGELDVYFGNLLGLKYVRPGWLPKVAYTWYALIGAMVVFVVGVLFRTPQEVLDQAVVKRAEAQQGEEKPMVLR
ncbi:MAG TPA: sodium:solute symporter [Tepidisphaeraceae bacterium]|nr:sodium:solute symporter [Tepidisphaeraceae bacterium]